MLPRKFSVIWSEARLAMLWRTRAIAPLGAGAAGAPFEELAQVLPDATRNELKVLLRELKEAGRAQVRGTTRAARWHSGREEMGR